MVKNASTQKEAYRKRTVALAVHNYFWTPACELNDDDGDHEDEDKFVIIFSEVHMTKPC